MHGFLIIDKPQGITSHDVVRRVRRLCKTRRVGHTGTLDPLATGVLPLALGEATRLVQFVLEGDKGYRAVLKLGETTDTLDSEGVVLERRETQGVTADAVREAFGRFQGPIQQIPPMYSAIKQNGVALHKLARQGIEVERQPREVRIHRLEILSVDLPFVSFEVECSKGTYVRTLCQDIGDVLGVGAHMTGLRRFQTGAYSESESIGLEDLESASAESLASYLLSPLQAMRGYARAELSEGALAKLRFGIPPERAEVDLSLGCEEGAVVAFSQGAELLAVARFMPSRPKEKRGDFELIGVFVRPG